MKKKLTLWILLLPFVAFAQSGVSKNGTITIDFGKKKKQQQEDTTQQQQQYPDDAEEEEAAPKPKKQKTQTLAKKQEEENPDFRKDGLFKGLFTAGINGCQVDGDNFAGYKKPGLEAGVGVMLRFHKNFSASMELGYTMKGAREALIPRPDPVTPMLYRSQFDYIQVPLGVSVHDKKIVMFTLGVAPSVLVRFKERDSNGDDITDQNPYLSGSNGPKRFDLPAFAALHFIIKKHFALGLKFSYSTFKSRGAYNLSRVNGQYHNVFTLRFMYILDAVKK